jgi:hypothetical protein
VNVLSTRRRAIALAIALAVIPRSGGRLLAQQTEMPGTKLFFSTNVEDFQFGKYLFVVDEDTKEYSHHLKGPGMSANVGWQLKRSFSLGAELFDNKASGTGDHRMDIGNLNIKGAAYLPMPAGKTDIEIRGLMADIRRSFTIGKIQPYVEGAVGGGTAKVNFSTLFSAVDPLTGIMATKRSNDIVGRSMPVSMAGAGVEIPFRVGLVIQVGYRLQEGSAIGIGVKFYPFRHSLE